MRSSSIEREVILSRAEAMVCEPRRSNRLGLVDGLAAKDLAKIRDSETIESLRATR